MFNPAFVTAYVSPKPIHIGASLNEAIFEDMNTSFVSDPGVELCFCALIRRRGRKARATISGATVFVVSSCWNVAISLLQTEHGPTRVYVRSYIHIFKSGKGGL